MDGGKVVEIYNKMVLDRGNMQNVWAEVVRFCYPQERRAYGEYGMNDTTPGKKRGVPVCSYPVTFAKRLGNSLTSSAFPSNDNWFDLSIVGTDGAAIENSDLKEWCRHARDFTQLKMRQGSNFYQEVGAMMHGLATLGTAGFYTYYKNGELRFRYVPIHKNLYIARNSDGAIDMVAVLHEWTAKEAIEEYGINRVSNAVRMALDSGLDTMERFRYVQLIYPKTPFGEKYNPRRGGKPYGDITVELDSKTVVAERGHNMFPFAIPRFYVNSDDLYGRSPAMEAMPLIKAMNTLRRTVLDAAVRAIKPPLVISTMTSKQISLEAGAINRIANFDPNGIWTYPVQSNFNIGLEQGQEMLEELKQAFLIDIFQAIDDRSRMTATEITERVRQKVEAIAAVVARIHKEFSSVVVNQCLDLLVQNSELQKAPKVDEPAYLKIKYTSSMDAMIQQGIASKTMTFIAQAAQICQVFGAFPDANAVLNMEQILGTLLDCNMLPAGYLRPPKERDEIRKAQAQAQAQMQQAQLQAINARSMLDLAKGQKLQEGEPYNGFH